jgi:hypothetical protein
MRIEGAPDNAPSPKHSSSTLRVGKIYRFLVESSARGRGVLRLSNGAVIKARLDGHFVSGKWYQATAVRRAGHVVLQQANALTGSPVQAASKLGLPQDKVSEAIIRAFIREQLTLDPRALKTAYRRVSRGPAERREERARLTAILHRKGLLESEDLWERLIGVIDADGSDHHHRRDERGTEERGHRSGTTVRERKKQLRDSVAASVVTTDVPNDLLQLFNHVAGDQDHWMMIPLRASQSESQHATLRLHVPGHMLDSSPRKEIDFDFAILDVKEGENEWTFALRRLEQGEQRLEVSLLREKGRSPTERERSAFEAALKRIGVSFSPETGSNESTPSDGFSQGASGDILPNADIEV